MRVFISWSGERSKQVAEALHWWLPRVIQKIKPWVSMSDILKGQQWGRELMASLEEIDVGVLCITKENIRSPWLLFEAGALSKKGESTVMPYLLGISPSELTPPLQQFNAAVARDKEDTRRMLRSLNALLREDTVELNQLDDALEKWWDDLQEKLGAIPDSEEQVSLQPIASLETVQAKLTALTNVVLEMRADREKPKYPTFSGLPPPPNYLPRSLLNALTGTQIPPPPPEWLAMVPELVRKAKEADNTP